MNVRYYRKEFRLSLALVVFIPLLFPACKKDEIQSFYLPEPGDQAIIFTHKFQPDNYEEGKTIVVDRFSKAIENSGQIRRTYFLSRPDNSEVVAISLFHPTSDTEVWLNSDERDAVLTMLQPLYREPLDVQQFTAEKIHDSHDNNSAIPEYLPAEGDEVLMFIHLFKPSDFDTGTYIVVNEFSKAIKNSRQTRRTYFLNNPANDEMVVSSFFHPGSSTEQWLKTDARHQILAMLNPLYREPLEVVTYKVEKVHDTHKN